MLKYIVGCICFACIGIIGKHFIEKNKAHTTTEVPSKNTDNYFTNRLKQHRLLAKKYATTHHLNNTIGFLIDMKIPSGKYRFFVVDFTTDSVYMIGMVTHGSGSFISNDSLQFSNVTKSGCTSLGMYSIGQRYFGTFGLAYKLHGLNTTNNNAFKRFVVLHAHSCVPVTEIAPQHICQSLGCPTVAPLFLKQLQPIIDHATQPILLYIYY